jgi:Kdo2-lipid IVA lauroyltransferase/acyltransferase
LGKPLVQHALELLSRASLQSLYRLGDVLAFCLGNTPNSLSRQTRQNLALCFPDLDAAARRRLYRQVMRQNCYAATELAALWHWPLERVEACITRVEVCASFNECTRGRIILTPHLGSWEMLAVWLGNHSSNPMFLYKRRKNKAVEAYVKQARARAGGTPVPTKKAGLRQALIGLKQGRSLVVLPDQKPASNKAHIASSFFGFDAPTTTLVHSLSSKLDCEPFIAVVYRNSSAGEFSLHIEPLERAHLAGDEQQSAHYMNQEIERRVRACPEQYLWGYRRFSNAVYAAANQE